MGYSIKLANGKSVQLASVADGPYKTYFMQCFANSVNRNAPGLEYYGIIKWADFPGTTIAFPPSTILDDAASSAEMWRDNIATTPTPPLSEATIDDWGGVYFDGEPSGRYPNYPDWGLAAVYNCVIGTNYRVWRQQAAILRGHGDDSWKNMAYGCVLYDYPANTSYFPRSGMYGAIDACPAWYPDYPDWIATVTYHIKPDSVTDAAWLTNRYSTYVCYRFYKLPGLGEFVEEGGGETVADCIKIPQIPTYYTNASLSTRLTTLFAPTTAQMQTVASAMWSQSIFDDIKKLFANIGDAVVSAAILPFAQADLTTGEQRMIKIGYVDTGASADVAKYLITATYGKLTVPPKYNNYLDTGEYTTGEIYIPYVGYRPLDIDKCMGHKISVAYVIDTATGAGIAYLLRENDAGDDCVFGQYECTVGRQIPITSADNVSALATIGRAAAALSIGAPAAIATIGGSALGGGMRTNIQSGGGLSGNAGQIGVQQPFIVLNRPAVAISDDYTLYDGQPAFDVTTVGQAGPGYVQMRSVRVATYGIEAENQEIEQLLLGGVVLGD